MQRLHAIQVLKSWDKRGVYVFTTHMLAKLFSEDSLKSFHEGLHRLIMSHILRRACRGIYVNEAAACFDGYVIERIARALRFGSYNYVSLESALSEYGWISQIPVDRLTVMTTGRKGVYETPYGTIEFTHTKRSVLDILAQTGVISARPLRIATPETAWRDLKRVGRNIHLVEKRH
ncbi:MAG: hypothetical protein A3J38_04675 [Gammaproteobacteria bacterium RIFCSPHIGHO2_12_FULL_45_9]|nr:MAG: hypothetical protein A3J38_04675 [Gammaproteobacteria bacterium RIFCSPHIGHO2_12_FULL_45_9]